MTGGSKCPQIAKRMRYGLIKCIAETTIDLQQPHVEFPKNLEIDQNWWGSDIEYWHHSFWDDGDITLHLRGNMRGDAKVELFGVRLNAKQVADMLPEGAFLTTVEDSKKSKRRQDLPQLPEEIAKAWMQWFKSQPNPTKERAEQSAANMFANHNLSRDRIRELFGDSNMGRPRKTGD